MKSKPYKIIGAYDSETSNITTKNSVTSYPILHQLGLIDCEITEINSDNVETHTDINMFRNTLDLYEKLDTIVNNIYDYVPVICCHNLAFDMYGLSPWLNRNNVKVLAKSARKPIAFTIRDDDNNTRLVIWDTLIFSQQSLEKMGNDCNYKKAVGKWDYDLVRTPATPLSSDEIEYARVDIYTLLVWLSWWINRNTDIEPSKLGLNVVTKTGIVRERRRIRFDSLKGRGLKYNVGRYFLYRCRSEAPKSDDELYTMQAATRGGLTFCAMNSASVVYDYDGLAPIVAGFDATSQHPAQMVSHLVPFNFNNHSKEVLELAFDLIGKVDLNHVLDNWQKPFNVAFYACFTFKNLRQKENSIFKKYGIYPLASARYKKADDDDNGDRIAHDENRECKGYFDYGSNVKSAFGKVISADEITLYITELTAWEIWQCYEWDSVEAIHGYSTGRFTKPSDMDVISVMQFYEAKNSFKTAREEYYSKATITNGNDLKRLGIPSHLVECMENATLSDNDVEATYLSLKADLNSLFGISASNEYRRDTVLTDTGIEYEGEFGICNKPKNPKVWYQYGQRIVGWSRIAQIVSMMLVEPYCTAIVNGDTDSFKVVLANQDSLLYIKQALTRLSTAIDSGKRKVCERIKQRYPAYYNPLDGIGHYMQEFETKQYCASWNKAYCIREYDKRDSQYHIHFTLAGVPTKRRVGDSSCFIGIDGLADRMIKLGYSFTDICNLFLGYNVTFANDVINLNSRAFPEWGSIFFDNVTDYLGNTSMVSEPNSLALYPMSKTINDTCNIENATNLEHALANNPDINTKSVIVCATGIIDIEAVFSE